MFYDMETAVYARVTRNSFALDFVRARNLPHCVTSAPFYLSLTPRPYDTAMVRGISSNAYPLPINGLPIVS